MFRFLHSMLPGKEGGGGGEGLARAAVITENFTAREITAVSDTDNRRKTPRRFRRNPGARELRRKIEIYRGNEAP